MSTSTRTAQPARTRTARVFSALVNVVLVLATLAGLAYLAPALFGYERYVITGGSMSGSIEKYSVAFAKPVPVQDLAVGDVITYLPPADSGVNNLVTHRIVETDTAENGARMFTTQGDANPDPDPWTFALDEGTQPVVQHAVPHLGHLFVALADRDTRMLLIGVPAGLIALISLIELAKALRPSTRRTNASGDRLVPPPPATVGTGPDRDTRRPHPTPQPTPSRDRETAGAQA